RADLRRGYRLAEHPDRRAASLRARRESRADARRVSRGSGSNREGGRGGRESGGDGPVARRLIMLYDLGEHRIETLGEHFVAPSASVIGRVRLGRAVSVWFGAVIRGDVAPIVIGDGTNVQDNAVIHVDSD